MVCPPEPAAGGAQIQATVSDSSGFAGSAGGSRHPLSAITAARSSCARGTSSRRCSGGANRADSRRASSRDDAGGALRAKQPQGLQSPLCGNLDARSWVARSLRSVLPCHTPPTTGAGVVFVSGDGQRKRSCDRRVDRAMADVEERADLSASVRRGLAWGTLNSLLLRLGNLALGVILARLLAPEDFGVFAVALTVQTVLLTLADMGMSVDLVRAKHPASREPTVATVSAAISVLLALAMVSTADPVSRLMGAEDAAGTIMVLSLTLVVSGVGVVPYARLQRDFRQKQLLTCTGADFVLGTGVTIGLVLLGAGPFALGVGRVVGQTASTTLQFLLARVKPRFGFNVDVARWAVSFGLPLPPPTCCPGALSVDTVVISRIAGATALGLYVLAFNISSWPMTAIGQAIRSVSLAGFSRLQDQVGSFSTALALAWAIALPAVRSSPRLRVLSCFSSTGQNGRRQHPSSVRSGCSGHFVSRWISSLRSCSPEERHGRCSTCRSYGSSP